MEKENTSVPDFAIVSMLLTMSAVVIPNVSITDPKCLDLLIRCDMNEKLFAGIEDRRDKYRNFIKNIG